MKRLDLLIAIAVPTSWGIGLVVAKPVVTEFPPILLMALRFLVTALVLVWFVPIPRAAIRSLFWVALVAATLQYGFTFNGLRYLDAGTTALIVQAEVPFLVLLAAMFLNERIGIKKVLGMLVAFAGIYLITGQPQLHGKSGAIGMVLMGALLWAVGQVMVRRLGAIGGLTVIAWLAVLATPQLFIASFILEDGQLQFLTSAKLEVWGAVVYLGIVMTAFGYGCWYHVLGRYEAGKVAPFLLLTPISSVFGGVLFLGETLSLRTSLGGLVVIVGVALLVIERPSKPAARLDTM